MQAYSSPGRDFEYQWWDNLFFYPLALYILFVDEHLIVVTELWILHCRDPAAWTSRHFKELGLAPESLEAAKVLELCVEVRSYLLNSSRKSLILGQQNNDKSMSIEALISLAAIGLRTLSRWV